MRRVMRRVGLGLGLVFCFAMGSLTMHVAIEALMSGQLTYHRNGLEPVTVSPESGAFAYYYQVAFAATLGAFLWIFVLLCVLARLSAADHPLASASRRAVERLVWPLTVLGGVWLVLHVSRYWLLR